MQMNNTVLLSTPAHSAMTANEHLFDCTPELLVEICKHTELQITQLPLPIEYWENADISHLTGQEIRNLLLQNILIDDRSRLGLFTSLQVGNICTCLETRQISKMVMKGIRRDFIDRLQLNAKGLEKLIHCRNNRVYSQSKGDITTKGKAISITKYRCQDLELDDLEEFQITTTQVSSHFPFEITFMDSSSIRANDNYKWSNGCTIPSYSHQY